jgi:GNAT superfamily N-acetyltransferase
MSYLSENCKFSILRSPEDIKGFSCGDTDLDEFFSNDCFGYSRQLLGKTYCYKLKSDNKVICAFTLSNASIRVDDLPNARKKKIEADIPHQKSLKDYPAVLIGRLGVSENYKGLHIGSDTIEFIKYWFIDPFNKTGCRFVIVDAYNNPQTKSFYINNGFRVVFSSEEQEKEYRHLKEAMVLKTRLMYFDLFSLTKL